MTEYIKEIYFNNSYRIKEIICENYSIHLSDFKYKSLDGTEYKMIIKNKGCHGAWHIIELLSENKLYAINNLWYSNINNNFNAKIIKTETSLSYIKEKYNDENINYINSLDYVNESDIDEIKNICEESIKTHFIMEEEKIKDDFKNDNLFTYIYCGCNTDSLEITSYPYKYPDKNSKIYEVFQVYGETGGDFNIDFCNIYDAQKEFLERLNFILNSKLMKQNLEYFISKKDMEIFYGGLLQVDKKYLNKKLLEDAYSYNIIFAKCKKLNKIMNKENKLYIIKSNMIKKLNKEFDLNFIDYYLLNHKRNKSRGEEICHIIMKEIYPSHIFEKIRPKWLLNINSNYPLELDLYNDKLKIAVEYNGKQHYEFCPYFHKNEDHFIKQQERDLLKNELCIKNGIKLINIHY